MPISKPDYQLRLPLELEEDGFDAFPAGTTQPPTPEEVRLRSETARQALDNQEFPWMEEYKKLREGGWNWRVAAYIAWASSPKSTREPRTQDELAIKHLGLTSDRQISVWRRNNEAIDEMVAMLQSAPLWEHRSEIYDALIKVASSPEYKGHNDRKLALELLGDYVPKSKLEAELNKHIIDDLANLPFDEKLKLAGLDDPERLAEFMRSVETPIQALPNAENTDSEEGREDQDGE